MQPPRMAGDYSSRYQVAVRILVNITTRVAPLREILGDPSLIGDPQRLKRSTIQSDCGWMGVVLV